MDTETIYFISSPSPTLGRSPLHGMGGGLFGHYKEEEYLACLRQGLKEKHTAWTVASDNTESDIEKIIAQRVKLLVCAPGLRFQFYSQGFEPKNIIHLSTMDYVNNNIQPVINRITALCHEESLNR